MQRLLWAVFFIDLCLILIDVVCGLVGFKSSLLKMLILVLPVMLLFLHALYTLGNLRGLLFIIFASLTGFIAEIWALKTGTIFGGHYIYNTNSLMIFAVPVSVVFFWGVFIYMGYCITNSFLYWLNKEKPTYKEKNFLILPLLILLDGFFVVAIDLLMDPIQMRLGAWHWLEGGIYYGVPVGNFVGWFLVTVVVTGFYRLYEYFSPSIYSFSKKVFLMPVIGYAAICLSFGVSAIELRLISLMIIGLLLMFPTVIVNLFLFKASFNREKRKYAD